MTSYATAIRRHPKRKFNVSIREDSSDRLSTRLIFASGVVALTIAAAFTIFDLALRTADQVLLDRRALTPPEQADIAFGSRRFSFPGAWLTSPLALEDEMATSVSLKLPYEKLLTLLGSDSALGAPEGDNPHEIVLRFQMPETGGNLDFVNTVYIPKSVAMTATGPRGLAMRRFLKNTGYDGEILYIGSEGQSRFIARCIDQSAPETAGIRRPCLRTLRLSSELETVLQFDTPLLADWRKLDSLVEAFVRSISVRQ